MAEKIAPPPVTAAAAPAQAPSSAPASTTPVTAEVEFPAFNFNEQLEREDAEAQAAPIDTTAPSTPVAAPVAGTPEETPVTAPAKPAAQATAPVEQPAQPAAQPAPAQPVAEAPQPRVIDPSERVALAEGWPEHTRAEWLTGIQNGIAAHQEAQSFRSIFNMTAAEAETTWKPLIGEIQADPEMGDYLERAIDHYRAEKQQRQPQQPAQPQQPPVDQAARAEVAELKAWRQQRELAEANAYLEQEKTALRTQYPALNDQDEMEDLIRFAVVRAVKDPSYTLTRAAQDRAHRLTRTAPQQPAAADVPTLLGSGGANPSGTTPPPVTDDDNVVSSGRDVVQEYMRERGLAAR